MSPRLRLASSYAIALLLTVSVVGAGTFIVFRASLHHELESRLRHDLEQVTEVVSTQGIEALRSDSGKELLEGQAGTISLSDPNGTLLAGTRPRPGALIVTRVVIDTSGQRLLLAAAGTTASAEALATRRLGVLLALSPLVSLVLAGAGGFLLASRALRPVEEAYARERRFVADAAHELRTPVTFLRLGMEELRGQGTPPTDVQLDELGTEVDRLDRLVRELLELSRVEMAPRPRPENVDLCAVAASCVARFAPLAESRGLSLALRVPGVAVHGRSSASGVERVMTILLDNAIAYTQDGGVTVTVVDTHRPRIEVSDSGPGITPERRGSIFERFTTTGPSRSTADGGGSGLGLAIALTTAHAISGEISLESTPGKGSTFALSVPSATR